jgi:hypothetical protein
MSSDVFIIFSACDPDPAVAIQHAVELAGVSPSRIQDAVFGLDVSSASLDLDSMSRAVHAADLTCPVVAVSSPLRALSFSAASILSDDAALIVVVGAEADGCAAILLASPETVGLLNLLPPAHVAARSLSGPDAALRLASLTSAEVPLCKQGDSLILLHGLLADLESGSARWALLSSSDLSILIERT